MNGFQLAGDLFHLFAICFLIIKIIKSKSVAGISGRTQLLYATVFTTRYLDIFYYITTYNTAMKIIYLVSSYFTLLLIFAIFKKTYEYKEDVFLTEILIIPLMMLAFWVNHGSEAQEIFWTFSIYLEAVVILPQFCMIHRKKEVEMDLLCYLVALGVYRSLYVLNWVYRYYNEDHYDLISDIAGMIQVFIYILGLADLLFGGIKIIRNGNGYFLKRNIFFISDGEAFNRQSNQSTASLVNEKDMY